MANAPADSATSSAPRRRPSAAAPSGGGRGAGCRERAVGGAGGAASPAAANPPRAGPRRPAAAGAGGRKPSGGLVGRSQAAAQAFVAQGEGTTGNGQACGCDCLCGGGPVPAGVAAGSFGGVAGKNVVCLGQGFAVLMRCRIPDEGCGRPDWVNAASAVCCGGCAAVVMQLDVSLRLLRLSAVAEEASIRAAKADTDRVTTKTVNANCSIIAMLDSRDCQKVMSNARGKHL